MQKSSLAKFCVGMVTSPVGKAESIAQALLKEKLVACVNIVPQVKSMYWWEDKICTDEEALLILKTQTELKSQVVTCVKNHHEYKVPEVIFMDITDGNEDYLDWIRKSTSIGKNM